MTPVIIAARRTAVAPKGGALRLYEIHELSAPVIQAALADAGLRPDQVDEVILSNALGGGGNPARLAALQAGLPERVAGLTIDRQCVGGLDAILLAQAMVQSGQAQVVVAGGAESYSRRPIRMRTFDGDRAPEPYDRPPFTPWADRDPDMTQAAADLADKLGITGAAQADWAVESHRKALAADHSAEITPLCGLTADAFARDLKPQVAARAKVQAGSVTTATTAVAADGAAFVVVVAAEIARELANSGLIIRSGATLGDDPTLPGLAPVAAIRSALTTAQLTPADLSHAEVMEAYVAQAIACVRGANLPEGIVNTGGGALARGHPIGASGAILAVRLFHMLQAGQTGLAAIAAAGGLGTAAVFSRQTRESW